MSSNQRSPQFRTRFLIAVFSILAISAVAAEYPGSGSDSILSKRVGPGVAFAAEKQSSGPLNFCVLKIDLNNPHISVESEPARDHLFAGETVPDAVRRESKPGHTVIAAVNSDFWGMTPRPYTAVGLMVADGMICNMPTQRSVFAYTKDKRVFIGPVTMKVSVMCDGRTFEVVHINDSKATDGLTIMTPPYGKVVAPTKGKSIRIKLAGTEFLPNLPVPGIVVSEDRKVSSPLSVGTVVLRIPEGNLAESSFSKGAVVKLLAQIPEVHGVISECAGGGPRLVHNGNPTPEVAAEKVGDSFSTTKHPRTAVGVSKDGKTLYLVTVDGRQPRISIGQSLPDLAKYMLSLGCWDAMNLDGGGSTTMVVRGEVKNKPSDLKGPRPVCESLMVVSNAPTGKLAQLQINPEDDPMLVPAGATASISVLGFDKDYNPVPLSGMPFEWTSSNLKGKMTATESSASFKASQEPSAGSVRVALPGGIETGRNVTTVELDSLRVIPEVLVLSSGEIAELEILAASEGRNVPLQPEMILLHSSDNCLSASAVSVQGRCAGDGKLEVAVGKEKHLISYFVDHFDSVAIAEFDDPLSSMTLGGTNFDSSKSSLSIDRENKKAGKGSLGVTYSMKKGGGTSRISIPLNLTVEKEPAKLGIWILADGKEAWLRGKVVDSLGREYLLDFTEGSKGMYWKNEWRHAFAPLRSLLPRVAASGPPQFPIVVKELYIAQDQEALKASGKIKLDNLEAIYPPGSQAAIVPGR